MLTLYKNVIYPCKGCPPESEGFYYIKDTDPIQQIDEENLNFVWVPGIITDDDGNITFMLPGDYKKTRSLILKFSTGLKFVLKGGKTKGRLEATNIKKAEALKKEYFDLKKIKLQEIKDSKLQMQQEIAKYDGKKLLLVSELIDEYVKDKTTNNRSKQLRSIKLHSGNL